MLDNIRTFSGIKPLFFPDRDIFPLKPPKSLEHSDTEKPVTERRHESGKIPKSMSESPIFEHRFRDMVKKVESLPLGKALKRDAVATIWFLIRDIDDNNLRWREPVVDYDDSEFMAIEWREGNKKLYLNIDYEEQWWSMVLEKDGKTKIDFASLDYNNLSIHWEWIFND